MAIQLEHEARLKDALDLSQRLHEEGVRSRYRALLNEAIALANQALGEGTSSGDALRTLVQAHCARAEDARHGAGQLSRSAQRAPTLADCHEGWEKVQSITDLARDSASEALLHASALGDERLLSFAARAAEAYRASQEIMENRNQAYTFHTDPGFSFGEGWHLAAAAALAGVGIQIEPDKAQTAQAQRFLNDAGLGGCLFPYRPRPRAKKQLTPIVAEAFKIATESAQETLRSSFLGEGGIPAEISTWVARRLGDHRGPKVMLWIRRVAHDAMRNTRCEELRSLAQGAKERGFLPILFGDKPGGDLPGGAVDLTGCWRAPLFQGVDMRRAQLQLFDCLRAEHQLLGQVGVTSAGMDGPALLGLPTIYLTQETNPRMRRWVGAVPGYQEVVQEEGYLDKIKKHFSSWGRRGTEELR